MEFAKKDFSYYWIIIRLPLLALVLWSILSVIIARFAIQWHSSIFGTWQSMIIQLIVFGFIGYTIIAEHKGEVRHSAWGGAITGVIVGFIGAILALIAFYFVPQMYEAGIQQAVAQGAPEATVRSFMKLGLYIGFVTGPLFSGLIGAGISAIAGVITKKVVKK